ncbi:MAG: bifunctional 4-hydroxy-2-oxoglutarate aldolase/2-dehydro-3-deoxy-phosphogluconate aldolase [Gammaproteobacteria bacterium]|jgi:2-dehydro-3-deoxyphosphogluconate aldolase/(4S)-4-hydroxy-2-oxoglutarate aldolase|nr:bifunctional 4-hydroxy-2-oxoglutarate aldolase/2-dehydro-3-deoxy-phosphogluconate aldolase [Gammaproteobacteria bacterium]
MAGSTSDVQALLGTRVVPVIVLEDAGQAVELARTLCSAGLPVLEITLRTEAAAEAIRRIAAEVPQAVVGAGSVRSAGHLRECIDAGARFAVSPGASPGLLDAADDTDLPLVPGAATASEVMRLLERGYVLQKFFPAEGAGGTAMLKALGAPLPEARFFPTGGITAALARDYLALPNVDCVGGSWVAPPALLAAGDFEAIGRLASAAAAL